MTVILLLLWFVVTFVVAFHARSLNDQYTFLGFPLAFYMGAQGALLVYLLIVWVYSRLMGYLDRVYQVNEDDDR